MTTTLKVPSHIFNMKFMSVIKIEIHIFGTYSRVNISYFRLFHVMITTFAKSSLKHMLNEIVSPNGHVSLRQISQNQFSLVCSDRS